jgi:hypothetical protein
MVDAYLICKFEKKCSSGIRKVDIQTYSGDGVLGRRSLLVSNRDCSKIEENFLRVKLRSVNYRGERAIVTIRDVRKNKSSAYSVPRDCVDYDHSYKDR